MNSRTTCKMFAWCCVTLLPVGSFALDAEALSKQATIRRDNWGVPHILAETEEAAAFAYGYASAEDHVLDIARLYLTARSEEAKYFGEKFAESDLQTKMLRMYRGAEVGYARTAPWFTSILDGYAAGYNRYIEKNRGDLPEWVKPLNGIDVMAHARHVLVMEFCMNLRQIKSIGRTQTAALDSESAFVPGSNMWAINSTRSASGNALLLGNPHLRWSGSHTWHEVHTTVPGKINFMGAALIGFPGAGIGFNDHLGWSHTVNPHDCDDIYELDLDPSDPGRYLYEGASLPMSKETISIEVKTEGGVETKSQEVYWTHYGPVVKTIGNKAYAYKSPNIDEYRFIEQWYRMTKATNFEEFQSVLDMQAIPMFNIGYADREGNCYYLWNGRFPVRAEGYDWGGVVPGGIAETEWTHLMPESKLPQLFNPEGGYIQNSNSAPWYTNLNAIIDRSQYPDYLAPLSNSLRTQMSLEMIEGDSSISFEEMMDYKYNYQLLLADRVKDDLIRAARGHTVGDVNLDEAADVLEAWDNRAAADSRGAVLFVNFWMKYRKGNETLYAQAWDEARPVSTPFGIGDADRAREDLAAAVLEMQATLGAIDVPWGAVFRLRKGDVDLPMSGMTGDFGSFRVIGYAPADDGKMVALGGDSYVFAVEFGERIESRSILAYSQSNDPDSPHYTDQCALFAGGEWKNAWFYESDIEEHLERSYHP